MKQDSLLTKVVMVLLFAAVLTYLALSFAKGMTNPYRMVAVYNDVAEHTLTQKAWAFREEVRLPSAFGLVNYQIDEGEKVAAYTVVALSYQDQEALKRQQKLRVLTRQISQLDYALSDEAPDGQTLEDQLTDSLAELAGESSHGDFGKLVTVADTYKRTVLRREYLYTDGSAATMGSAARKLGQSLAQLQNYTKEGTITVTAPRAGVFSTEVDGYETICKPELLPDISPRDFRGLVEKTPLPDGGSIGKIATDSIWYLALVVEEGDLPQFREGAALSVRVSALASPFPMTVYQVGFVQDGEAVVVLASRRNQAEAVSLREQSVTVIFKSETGIHIPQKALRVREDGQVGVYTVTGYQAEFKPVSVLSEETDYYLVKPAPAGDKDKRVLRSGDLVIITDTDLYEGKVVR
jgi:hypothetical protein